jgi:hypothetical protein
MFGGSGVGLNLIVSGAMNIALGRALVAASRMARPSFWSSFSSCDEE